MIYIESQDAFFDQPPGWAMDQAADEFPDESDWEHALLRAHELVTAERATQMAEDLRQGVA